MIFLVKRFVKEGKVFKQSSENIFSFDEVKDIIGYIKSEGFKKVEDEELKGVRMDAYDLDNEVKITFELA